MASTLFKNCFKKNFQCFGVDSSREQVALKREFQKFNTMLPIFNNPIEAHFGVVNTQMKAKKRQLERVRRQRINERLEKLKVIVMKHLGNDVGFYPPMEKADILELAIRCLEGKDQTSPNKDPMSERKLFERLENTSSPKRETTPVRKQCLKTPTTTRKHEQDENTDIAQFAAEFKPLLQHPIRSFSKRNEYDGVTDQSSIKSNDSLRKSPIWRPWTL